MVNEAGEVIKEKYGGEEKCAKMGKTFGLIIVPFKMFSTAYRLQ